MTDDPKPRPALYYRLRNGLPAMCWPISEDETFMQIGRTGPRCILTGAVEIILDVSAAKPVTAEAYHSAMASGKWFDGENSWETE